MGDTDFSWVPAWWQSNKQAPRMPGLENKTKYVLNVEEPQTVKKLILHKDVYCFYHNSGVTRRKWACQLEFMSLNVSQVEVEFRLLIDT